ncbi:MAG: heavy metal translocating P-type ATPase [Myxococcales bacterium FL481]|nr:MAG: heavy metal translocating P-type ATPase [Myxococcales bacterium FL481]
MNVECAHCGLPASGEGEGPHFCCHGCRTVYELLHQCGLDDFYALAEQAAVERGVLQTNVANDNSFAHLDDLGLQRQLGDPGAGDVGDVELRITGMRCTACVWLVERLPEIHAGALAARVDLARGRVRVRWDRSTTRLSQLAQTLNRLGYSVHALDIEAERAQTQARRRELWRLGVAGACAGNTMLLSFALYAGDFSGMSAGFERFFAWGSLLLTLPSVTYAAWPFYRAAWAGLRARQLHLDLPLSLGIVGATLGSVWTTVAGGRGFYFDSLSMLVFLLLVGRFVQDRGQRWALSRAQILQALIPPAARVHDGERWREVHSPRLQPGQRIAVRHGEVFPADARVLDRPTRIDASSLTGEARPVSLAVGQRALAGTRNIGSDVELEVVRAGSETRIGKLAGEIVAAGSTRSPLERGVDRLSRWFTAGVLLLASGGGLTWWWLDPSRALDIVVALLVVSCPCALGLATPLILATARAQAAQQGIVLASASALESLPRIGTIAFDKTGTLTQGDLSVCREPALTPEIRRAIAALEADSEHPVAMALVRWARSAAPSEATPSRATVTSRRERAGLGVEGVVAGKLVRIGSAAWLGAGERNASFDAIAARGWTPVVVEVDGSIAGVLGLGDNLRDDAEPALRRLEAMGARVTLLSGDHPNAVRVVADRLGIQDAHGALSPEGKAQYIRAHVGDANDRRGMAMVGDGINDAAALKEADVGIAVRGGAEVALRVADVHLSRRDLGGLVALFEGARAVRRTLHATLGFATIYNVVLASAALAGRVTPLVAAVAMPLASLTVISIARFARSFRTRTGEPRPSADPTVSPGTQLGVPASG